MYDDDGLPLSVVAKHYQVTIEELAKALWESDSDIPWHQVIGHLRTSHLHIVWHMLEEIASCHGEDRNQDTK